MLIGPHDLSCSLGIPEQYDHPKFGAAVQQIVNKAREKNVGAGIHFWEDIRNEIDWVRRGMNLLIHSGDITLFAKHLEQELSFIRRAVATAKLPSEMHLHAPHKPQQVVI